MRRQAILVATLAVVNAACSSAPPAAPTNAGPTPTETPFVLPSPTPYVGSGKVTFGRAGTLDKSALVINPTRSSFDVSTRKIAWSAEFTETANASKLKLIIARVLTGGSEQIKHSETFDLSDPRSDILANTSDLGALVGRKRGTYVLRILRGGTVLAEGKFTLK